LDSGYCAEIMRFILIPLVSVFICQILKIILYIGRREKLSMQNLIWEGFWVGKFPSSHAALIASLLYLLWKDIGFSSVFAFAFFISLLIIYSLLENRKRREIIESHIGENKKLQEFDGHTVFEIISGIVIGIVVAIFLDYII